MTIEITIKKTNDHSQKALVRTVDYPPGEEPITGEPIELKYGEEVTMTIWDTRTVQVFEEIE